MIHQPATNPLERKLSEHRSFDGSNASLVWRYGGARLLDMLQDHCGRLERMSPDERELTDQDFITQFRAYCSE